MASRIGAHDTPLGMALILVANVFFTAGTVLFKRWAPEQHLTVVNGIQLLATAAVVLIPSLAFERLGAIKVTSDVLVALLYLTLVVSLRAMTIWFFMLRSGDAARATSYFFLNPVFGLFLGALLLSEPLRPLDFVGAAGVEGAGTGSSEEGEERSGGRDPSAAELPRRPWRVQSPEQGSSDSPGRRDYGSCCASRKRLRRSVPVIPNGLPSIPEIAPDIGIVVCTTRTQGEFHGLVQLPVASPRPGPNRLVPPRGRHGCCFCFGGEARLAVWDQMRAARAATIFEY